MGAVLDRLMALPTADRNRFIRKEMTDEMALALLWDWTEMGRENQQAPLGEWRWWLILAGRWWGKTRTGSEWINAKAREARKLGLQYRFALVAETKADCRDVLAEGESGLLAKAPPWNRPKYEVSKRRITWPDQHGQYSELTSPMGFLYSGEEPDQLRGPQFTHAWVDEWCFLTGTPILTDRGMIPIEQVTRRDRAWTRKGWRQVQHAWQSHPAATVYRMTTNDGRELIGTGGHPIYVHGRGFVPLRLLQRNDILVTCDTLLSDGTVNLGTTTRATTEIGRDNCCIVPFTSSILDPFLTATRSTIRTAAELITYRTTLRHSLGLSIERDINPRAGSTSPRLRSDEWRHSNGGGNSENEWDGRRPVRPAVNDLLAILQNEKFDFALAGVSRRGVDQQVEIWNSDSAYSAGRDSLPVNTSRHNYAPNPASIVFVQSVERLNDPSPVFNIEVEEEHEYFANKILVLNCKYQYPVETMDNLEMALRLGDNPQGIITTTPRPLPMIRTMIDEAAADVDDPRVVVTRGSSYDNYANISVKAIKHISAKYEGTRLGRQELHAEILEDVEGGFWTRALLEQHRLPRKTRLPEMTRIAVAIDPATTSGEHANETGIMVGGLGTNGIAYLFEDKSGVFTPEAWGGIAISAYDEYQGDAIIGERNNGGDLVKRNIRACDGGDRPKIKLVWASRGKHVRAEPISSFHERGRIRFIGSFPDLEEQLVFYTPKGYEGESSPDRGDAFVWLMWFLLINQTGSSDPDDYTDSQR